MNLTDKALKKYFIFLLFSVLILPCHAQKKGTSEFYIGTSHGLSLSMLNFGVKTNELVHVGYNGGIFLTYLSNRTVGVQLEFNYAQKGWKINPDSTENYNRDLNYYEFPFTTHIIIGKKKSKFVIDLGPYGSYLKSEIEKTNMADSVADYVGYRVSRNFEFGYCLGIGYQYITKFGNFGLDARYYNSLTNIFIPSADLRYFSSRNQVLCINVKYSLRLF